MGDTVFFYDGFQHAWQATKGATIENYGYDGKGQRIYKKNDKTTIIYFIGPDGNVLSEYDTKAKAFTEYIYLNGQLAAKVGKGHTMGHIPAFLPLLLDDEHG